MDVPAFAGAGALATNTRGTTRTTVRLAPGWCADPRVAWVPHRSSTVNHTHPPARPARDPTIAEPIDAVREESHEGFEHCRVGCRTDESAWATRALHRPL